MDDHGPKPYAFDIEKATTENTYYRRTPWTGHYLQVTLMSIPPGESIGLEVHPKTDQFLRIDGGEGLCVMGHSKDDLDFRQEVSDGWAIQVPAGVWHDVTNTGDEPLQLYTVYAPVHHGYDTTHKTRDDSEHEEEVGSDVPPRWTHQD